MKVVFFDGYCTLCNALVNWLITIDEKGQLKFASLQGDTAAQLLDRIAVNPNEDTVIYLRDSEKFERSTAVLHVLADVGGVWQLARVFFIVPPFFRDFIYRIVAKNRYRFFAKRSTCRIPTPNERDRLLT